MTPERTRLFVLAGTVTAILALSTAVAVLADSPAPGSPGPAASGGPSASGPAPSGGPAASGGPSASGGNAISIIQKTFQPTTLSVHVGDTVTWTVTQAISDLHSVTSGSYKDAHPGTVFDSGIKLKNDGDSFTFTFTASGTYPFFCQVHPDTMSGTITVVDANGNAGGSEGPIPTESKVIAGAVLIAALILLFGSARLYRRMNPGP